MTEHEELLGADYMEHNIHHPGVGVTRAVSVLKDHKENVDLQLVPVGKNKGIRNLTESYSKIRKNITSYIFTWVYVF